ncbi:MAG: hypothetical protein HW418_661 [Anaerolineales bacterium]|nr:hypothetical protein [Anaerolineales bacterium]
MIWKLSILSLVLAVTGCTVQPLTPTPVEVTAPPVPVAEGPRDVATGMIVTVTPTPEVVLAPTESAPVAASATPELLPSPTEAALAALVVNPSPVPTDIPAVAALPPVPVAPPPPEDTAAAEQYTIDLINAERVAAGVAPLLRDETLVGIARARVADMVARGYTGHDDPVTGEHLAQSMMRAAGYTSSYLGENWYGSIQNPTGLVDTAMAWFMTDPPHAQNILSPNYAGVGVGIAFNGQQWLLVQDFAGANP